MEEQPFGERGSPAAADAAEQTALLLWGFISGWSPGLKQVGDAEAIRAGKSSCSSVSFHLLLAGFKPSPCMEKSHEKSI